MEDLKTDFFSIFIQLQEDIKNLISTLNVYLESIKYADLREHKELIYSYIEYLTTEKKQYVLSDDANINFDIFDDIENVVNKLNEIQLYVISKQFIAFLINDRSRTFMDSLNVSKNKVKEYYEDVFKTYNNLIKSIDKNIIFNGIDDAYKSGRGEISTELYILSCSTDKLNSLKYIIFETNDNEDINRHDFENISKYHPIQLMTYNPLLLFEESKETENYINLTFPQSKYYVSYNINNLINKNHIIRNEVLSTFNSGLNYKLVHRLRTIKCETFLKKYEKSTLLPLYNAGVNFSKNNGIKVEISNNTNWSPFTGQNKYVVEYLRCTEHIITQKIKKDKSIIDIQKRFEEDIMQNRIQRYEISKESLIDLMCVLFENMYEDNLPSTPEEQLLTKTDYITEAISKISFKFIEEYLLELQIKTSYIDIDEISKELKCGLIIHIMDLTTLIYKAIKKGFNVDLFSLNRKKENIMNTVKKLFKKTLANLELPAINSNIKLYFTSLSIN